MRNTKIGDVFEVVIDDKAKKYFQYITNDLTQLNSDVIRVFKRQYPIKATLNVSEIVADEVEFYAHCVTKWGIKLGCWKKVGNHTEVGKFDQVLFIDSRDYGDPSIKVSHNWWVWKINEEQNYIGKLTEKYKNAEIGVVIAADRIVNQMQTGEYNFVYPEYE
jgi:hypothetical protein